ncbi:hypothetical protein P4S72_26135 [Vibrio sp. PP-XX7]
MTIKNRVMLLEDGIRASYTLESTINQHDEFQVVAISETCADALMQFTVFQPQLVFVDITLPDGNGLDVIPPAPGPKCRLSFHYDDSGTRNNDGRKSGTTRCHRLFSQTNSHVTRYSGLR